MAESETTAEPQYQKGDRVEYRPVGGGQDNVSHSHGEITEIHRSGTEVRYSVKNDNTGKTTSYHAKNLVKKLEAVS